MPDEQQMQVFIEAVHAWEKAESSNTSEDYIAWTKARDAAQKAGFTVTDIVAATGNLPRH